MRMVEVIPVVIRTLGTVTKHFEKWTEKLKLDLTTGELQKTWLLGTTIIRKVLDMKWEKKNEATIAKTTSGWCPLL